MKVNREYIDRIMDSESIFDVAASCYEILEEEITNPILFVSRYLDEDNESILKNPNHEILRNFSDRISIELENYSEFNFVRKKAYIIKLIQNLELESFLQERENQLSVIFTLLSIIDSLVPFWDRANIAERGHLNKGKDSATIFVYLASEEYLHEAIIRKIGRERKSEGDFGETLSHLLFLKKEMLPKGAEAPEVCILSRGDLSKPYCCKAAIITGLTGAHFETVSTVGSTKVIKYIKKEQEKTAQEICRKMYDAIRQGAEFILLPEFCVSEEILGYIKSRLSEWMMDESLNAQLIAVFPGSTWIDSDDNVQFLLDAWGREIGRYYKNAPYRKKSKDGKRYEFCEGLMHPGHYTNLLWVKEIGYVLPATCRDVIDGRYTNYLVQSFRPTFLMVPAWSSSGSSFKQPLEKYAAEFFTNSVLCNGCGALKGSASIVGGATVLGKRKTVADGSFEAVKKPDVQTGECVEGCSRYCGYMLEMDFSPQNTTFENRIRQWKL